MAALSPEIHGYALAAPFSTTNSGSCQWTTAVRGGQRFFVKRFLRPTFPSRRSEGRQVTWDQRIERCRDFERRQSAINSTVSFVAGQTESIVGVTDFFLSRSHYYKITPLAPGAAMVRRRVDALSIDGRFAVLRCLTAGLRALHRLAIVHGDIRPENVVVSNDVVRTMAKLVDYDDCYIEGEPPASSEIVGDMGRYSPEVARYVLEGSGGKGLTAKSDIFSLGLLFVEVLTGQRVDFLDRYRYPWCALLNDSPLHLEPTGGSRGLDDLIRSMLHRHPEERPDSEEVYALVCQI